MINLAAISIAIWVNMLSLSFPYDINTSHLASIRGPRANIAEIRKELSIILCAQDKCKQAQERLRGSLHKEPPAKIFEQES
jgi:hypothetical protein